MVNKVVVIISAALISGCAQLGIKDPDLRVQESLVPILYCPAPPKIERPTLPIETLTDVDNQNPGLVAKKYKATIKILQGYSVQLEEILKSYMEASDAYEELRKRFKDKEKAGEFDSSLEKVEP